MIRTSALLLLLLLLSVSPALAEKGGTYRTATGYALELTFDGDTAKTVEPNKTTVFQKKSANEYVWDPGDGRPPFGIRVIDDDTMEFFRPGTGNPPTVLTRAKPHIEEKSPAESANFEKYNALAQGYLQKSQSDPANAHVWASCGTVAYKRAVESQAAGDAYAREAVTMLKPIMADAGTTPCPEVISQAIWGAVR